MGMIWTHERGPVSGPVKNPPSDSAKLAMGSSLSHLRVSDLTSDWAHFDSAQGTFTVLSPNFYRF